MVLPLLILVGVAIYLMSADERARVLRSATLVLRALKAAATRPDPANERFHAALRARTSHPLITWALIAANTVVFVGLLFGAGRRGDAETLIAWGGNVGLRTTNGEWWRLLTAMFVHPRVFVFVINMTALAQIGAILERLAGRVTFVAAYLAAGVFASLSAVSAYPVDVSVGASGAICGLFGMLAGTLLWLYRQPSDVRIPAIALRRLSPVTVAFFACSVLNGNVRFRSELAGLAVGFVGGVLLTRRIHERKPSPRRIAVALASAISLILIFAIPLRGIADVRPEIARLVALEHRTASAYEGAVERFKKGRMTAEALAQMIARSIVPELQAADARLETVHHVPPIHQPLVADAREYLRLRTRSWQLRAEGLHNIESIPLRDSTHGDPAASTRGRVRAAAQYRANTATLAKAEEAERASLSALQRIH
jgi:membrane associated rhomboid family serine protease